MLKVIQAGDAMERWRARLKVQDAPEQPPDGDSPSAMEEAEREQPAPDAGGEFEYVPEGQPRQQGMTYNKAGLNFHNKMWHHSSGGMIYCFGGRLAL